MKTAILADVATFGNGGTPSRAKSEYWDGSTPWITGADISGDQSVSARSFITEKAVRGSSTRIYPAGTVVLVTRTSVGKVGVLHEPTAINQDLTAITPATDLDSGYLVHFLRTCAEVLAHQARGATIKGVTREAVEKLRLPFPPLPEQRRIAAILDHADVLRAERRQVLAHLDTLTRSIFHDMFGDPVSNDHNLPLHKLDALGQLGRGVSKHRPRNDPDLLGGAYPLIQTGDVANSGGYITEFTATYSEIGLSQSRLWPAGTLCITIAANIAKTGILTFDACFPDSIVGFTADADTVTYVRVWLGFLQATLESSAPQSAQRNINLATLRGLHVPTPARVNLGEFTRRVDAVNTQRTAVLLAKESDAELFTTLQSRAFRGEL